MQDEEGTITISEMAAMDQIMVAGSCAFKGLPVLGLQKKFCHWIRIASGKLYTSAREIQAVSLSVVSLLGSQAYCKQ